MVDASVLEDDVFEDEQPEGFEEPIPMLADGWATYGDYQLVGNGEVTNSHCGQFSSHYRGCLRVDLHNKTIFGKDGKSIDCRGKVYARPVFYSCDKPSCPVCFKYGWASREAKNIEARLKEASKRFGQVEHIIISVPVKDYGLEPEALRRKVNRILRELGIIGGVTIVHDFRYNKRKLYWYFSPHFHVLGYILGSYRKCRRCSRKNNCLAGCSGFDDRRWQGFKKHGYYVKVLGKRKTIRGTAWYQLHHSSIKKGVKRFHVATWFGCCSYRKLKVTPEMKKQLCPICQRELYDILYIGYKEFYLDRNSPLFKRELFEDYREGVDNPRINNVVWIEKPKKSRRRWLQDNESPVRIFKGHDIDKLFRVE
jgi:hypothetical protein